MRSKRFSPRNDDDDNDDDGDNNIITVAAAARRTRWLARGSYRRADYAAFGGWMGIARVSAAAELPLLTLYYLRALTLYSAQSQKHANARTHAQTHTRTHRHTHTHTHTNTQTHTHKVALYMYTRICTLLAFDAGAAASQCRPRNKNLDHVFHNIIIVVSSRHGCII